MIKKVIKQLFNSIGYEILRLEKVPKISLLGIKSIPIRTIIDVGANEGQFAGMIERVFPEARMYCFEPIREPFRKLDEWPGQKTE